MLICCVFVSVCVVVCISYVSCRNTYCYMCVYCACIVVPLSVSVRICVCVCMSVVVCTRMSLYVLERMYVHACQCVSRCVSVCLSVCMGACRCVYMLYVFVCVIALCAIHTMMSGACDCEERKDDYHNGDGGCMCMQWQR